MDDQLLYLRKQHGDVYVTQLPSGQIIPWRPLSTGEYLQFSSMYEMGKYPHSFVEDEIFTKCVLDRVCVDNIGQLKAGIVSTVSVAIMEFSGPNSTDELNQLLDYNRVKASQAMNMLVGFVCQGFPAYKPEDVEAMSYPDLMYRAAQAETKLLSAGLIQEPLNFFDAEPEDQTDVDAEERRRQNQQMLNKHYEQQGIEIPDTIKTLDREKILNYPKPPPVPADEGKQTIITKSDMMEHDAVMSGHDLDVVTRMNSTQETAQFYAEYLEQLKDGGKLAIKSPEERKAAAEARSEENRLKNLKTHQENVQAVKDEIPKLLKVREDARRRKARKAAKRRR